MHGKADRHMKLLTLERESSLGSLWDQEQCAQFCSKDELWEAAKEEEMKIPWKEAQEGLTVPEDQYYETMYTCARVAVTLYSTSIIGNLNPLHQPVLLSPCSRP